jgi:hypothetical protein
MRQPHSNRNVAKPDGHHPTSWAPTRGTHAVFRTRLRKRSYNLDGKKAETCRLCKIEAVSLSAVTCVCFCCLQLYARSGSLCGRAWSFPYSGRYPRHGRSLEDNRPGVTIRRPKMGHLPRAGSTVSFSLSRDYSPPVMTNQAARAKSLILKWFDNSGQPADMRGKLSSGIDRLLDEIGRRDSWSESRTVLLGDHSAARFETSGRDWRAISCRDGLAVSTIVPGWGAGWSRLFRDEYVYDILSWLVHYSHQYVHRSHVAKVLMIAWERDGAVLQPFGSESHIRRYGPLVPPTSPGRALAAAVEDSVTRWGKIETAPHSRSRWARRNTFDPAIHQAVFHFLRGQTLKSSEFMIEALVAFDCVLQSLQTIGWDGPVGDPRRNRADLVATLGLSTSDGTLAQRVYFLRNEFGAHAGGWRWWDADEYFDDEFMTKASSLTHRLLQRAADAEPDVRRIDPRPNKWSDWFMKSFPLLFRAIWFPAGG